MRRCLLFFLILMVYFEVDATEIVIPVKVTFDRGSSLTGNLFFYTDALKVSKLTFARGTQTISTPIPEKVLPVYSRFVQAQFSGPNSVFINSENDFVRATSFEVHEHQSLAKNWYVRSTSRRYGENRDRWDDISFPEKLVKDSVTRELQVEVNQFEEIPFYLVRIQSESHALVVTAFDWLDWAEGVTEDLKTYSVHIDDISRSHGDGFVVDLTELRQKWNRIQYKIKALKDMETATFVGAEDQRKIFTLSVDDEKLIHKQAEWEKKFSERRFLDPKLLILEEPLPGKRSRTNPPCFSVFNEAIKPVPAFLLIRNSIE